MCARRVQGKLHIFVRICWNGESVDDDDVFHACRVLAGHLAHSSVKKEREKTLFQKKVHFDMIAECLRGILVSGIFLDVGPTQSIRQVDQIISLCAFLCMCGSLDARLS